MVVADGEPSVRATENGVVWAVLGGASNGLGAVPHDLGEVEELRAAHGWARVVVVGVVVVDLSIVPLGGDSIRSHRGAGPVGDGVRVASSINVLAVTTSTLVPTRAGQYYILQMAFSRLFLSHKLTCRGRRRR